MRLPQPFSLFGGFMQLSKRLQALTELVTKGLRVADIGCDHAYVSIHLMEQNIASKVIAMDINKGPLERAKENIKKYGFENQIETRLSNGAQKLELDEVDAVLIAGMGGALMSKILAEKEEVVDSLQELILQPQSELFLVRRHIREHHFRIVEERMLVEDGKYYTMMKAVKGEEPYVSEVCDYFGKYLLEHKDEILRIFLEKELNKKTKIYETLQKDQEKHQVRLQELQEEIKLLQGGLSYYVM